ncbi:DUF262 domain-containing protein [Rossellomorea sp. BNER]|uniref:DUF262 domain-containing protein n=1 Tax=Rossellomorea sp. BNER TaxID=2962031 RepID=UPI003AF2DC46|nr:DUF262 domain-containing HNH endonuclease family protein [Rossellomorea sp. BNER]
MNIESYIKTVNDILSENNTYHVTRFQREYAWEKDDLQEFWNDINSAINKVETEFFTSDYFIGSAVMINQEKSPRFDIVDGQQRLTTISILISVIIEAFKEFNEDEAKAIYNKLIVGTDPTGQKTFKVINENAKEYLNTRILFYDKVESEVNNNEERRLLFAYEFFRKELIKKKREYKEDFQSYLNILINQIERLKTIFITVDKEDEAYIIFEILNSKGHDLENIDLIKNLIFKLFDQEFPIDRANTNWKKIKDELMKRDRKLDIDTYFRTYWLSRNGYISKTKLYNSVKDQIVNETQAKNLLEDLLEKVDLYQKICNPQENDWTETRKRIIYDCAKALNLFAVNTPRPFILALLNRHQAENRIVKIKEIEDVLSVIENFHFIFTAVSSQRASGLDRMYAKYAKEIAESDTIQKTREIILDFKSTLESKLPSKEEFTKGFRKLYFTNDQTKDKKLIQYIFKKWEGHLRRTQELTTYHFTLEHIYPQTPPREFVGYIGNLLPLDGDINNKIDKKPFPRKIELMEPSELEVVKVFIEKYEGKVEWEEDDIKQRTKEIAVLAYDEIWSLG